MVSRDSVWTTIGHRPMASSIIIGFLSILVEVLSGSVHRFPPSVVCVGYRTTLDPQIYRGSRLPFFQSFVRATIAFFHRGYTQHWFPYYVSQSTAWLRSNTGWTNPKFQLCWSGAFHPPVKTGGLPGALYNSTCSPVCLARIRTNLYRALCLCMFFPVRTLLWHLLLPLLPWTDHK
jgi:hypothetical protein